MTQEQNERKLFDILAPMQPDERQKKLESADLTPEDRDKLDKLLGERDAYRRALERVQNTHPIGEGTKLGEHGQYTLKRPVGQGGFASVWLAHTTDTDHDPKVAIKILHDARDPQGLEYFRREQEMLQMLHREGVASTVRVLKTGSTYYVMEYIDGEELTDYCNRLRMSLEDRLNLFVKLAEVVAHINVNCVAHRDINPSNVLVVGEDRSTTPSPHIKVIDLGIARRLWDETANEAGVLSGLRGLKEPYAAPEQCHLDTHIDIRADIHALGVVLEELYLERVPGDSVDPGIPEELRCIIAKARHHSPDRRYPSAADLAADVEAYLNGKPVMAALRQESPIADYVDRWATRLKRRLKAWRVGLIVAILASLSAGGRLYLYYSSQQEALRAEKAQYLDFLEGTLLDADPTSLSLQRLPPNVIRPMADHARMRIDEGRLDGSPSGKARLQVIVATLYKEIQDFATAHALLNQVFDRNQPDLKRSLGLPLFARALNARGECEYQFGDFDLSLKTHAQALEIRATQGHGSPRDRCESHSNMAVSYLHTGDFDKARESIKKAIEIAHNEIGECSEDLAFTLQNSARIHLAQGSPLEQADNDAKEALTICDQLSRGRNDKYRDKFSARTQEVLAEIAVARKAHDAKTKIAKALEVLETKVYPSEKDPTAKENATDSALVTSIEATAPPKHREIAVTMRLLAIVEWNEQPSTEASKSKAIEHLNKAVDAFGEQIPESHPDKIQTRADLADYLMERADLRNLERAREQLDMSKNGKAPIETSDDWRCLKARSALIEVNLLQNITAPDNNKLATLKGYRTDLRAIFDKLCNQKERIPRPERVDCLARTARRLARVYHKWGEVVPGADSAEITAAEQKWAEIARVLMDKKYNDVVELGVIPAEPVP